MCLRLCVIILCCVFLHVSCLDKIPCSLDDHKCVTQAAVIKYSGFAAGIPSIGLESSDPLHTNLIRQSLQNIHYEFNNAFLYGLGNCSIASYEIYSQQQYSTGQFTCPRLMIESDCNLYGQLGYLHVHGKGACKIVINDIKINAFNNLAFRVNEDGKIYVHLVKSQFGFDFKGGIEYEFRNLYNENQELSNTASYYATQHWNMVSESILVPGLLKFLGKWVHNANVYFAHFPVEDVFSRLIAE